MNKKNCCVVVSSTDSYSDLWDPYFFFFFKFWSNCPFKIYLVSESKTFHDPRVTTITTGQRFLWTENLLHALSSVPENYVILSLEDFFLRQHVDNREIIYALDEMLRLNISMLRIHPNPKGTGPLLSNNIKEISEYDDYSISTQSSIWKKSFLTNILEKPLNIWQFELTNSQRRFTEHRLATVEKSIFNYRHHMVQSGKLFPWVYFILFMHGYNKKVYREILSIPKVLEWFLRVFYLKLFKNFKRYILKNG